MTQIHGIGLQDPRCPSACLLALYVSSLPHPLSRPWKGFFKNWTVKLSAPLRFCRKTYFLGGLPSTYLLPSGWLFVPPSGGRGHFSALCSVHLPPLLRDGCEGDLPPTLETLNPTTTTSEKPKKWVDALGAIATHPRNSNFLLFLWNFGFDYASLITAFLKSFTTYIFTWVSISKLICHLFNFVVVWKPVPEQQNLAWAAE